MKAENVDFFDDSSLISNKKKGKRLIALSVFYLVISFSLSIWQNWSVKETLGMILILLILSPILLSQKRVVLDRKDKGSKLSKENSKNMFNNPNIFDYCDPHRPTYNELDSFDPKNPWK